MLTGGAWLERLAARRWLIVGVAGAVVAAGASVAVALGGSRAPAARTPPAKPAHPAPMPAQCASWGCTKAQTVALGNSYAISLWRAGKPGDYRTQPVVELARGGVAVQWWLSPDGYGWSGSLTCSVRAPEPNCVLTDGDGAHSSVAQQLVLRASRLVAPPAVIADLPTVIARDLDGDDYLDVIALDSDYTPNFAQGHVYWHTYRFAGGSLASTGCTRRDSPDQPAPVQLLAGTCPRR